LQAIEDWEPPHLAHLEVLKLAHCKELTVIDGPMQFLGFILGTTVIAEAGSKPRYHATILDGYKRWVNLYVVRRV
jgi:hypothetical protein